jgi:chemotaxis protein histidine kinase CheA
MGARLNGRMRSDREVRPEPPHSDVQAASLQAIHHDAQELSEVQSALQEQLQLLQKGMLHKDLAENLKKTEKLAKKLRQEVTR